eukprot:403347912
MPNSAYTYPFVAYYDTSTIKWAFYYSYHEMVVKAVALARQSSYSEYGVIALQNEITFQSMFIFMDTTEGTIISKSLDSTIGTVPFIDGIIQNGLIMDTSYNVYFAGNTYVPTLDGRFVLIGKISAGHQTAHWGIKDTSYPILSDSSGLIFGTTNNFIYALTSYLSDFGELSKLVIHKIEQLSGSRTQSYSIDIGTSTTVIESQIGDAHVIYANGLDVLSGCGQFMSEDEACSYVFLLLIDFSSHIMIDNYILKVDNYQQCLASKTLSQSSMATLFYDEYENEFNLNYYNDIGSTGSTMERKQIVYNFMTTVFDAIFIPNTEYFIFSRFTAMFIHRRSYTYQYLVVPLIGIFCGPSYNYEVMSGEQDLLFEVSVLFVGDENCIDSSIRTYESFNKPDVTNQVEIQWFDEMTKQIVIPTTVQLPSINVYQVNCYFVDGQMATAYLQIEFVSCQVLPFTKVENLELSYTYTIGQQISLTIDLQNYQPVHALCNDFNIDLDADDVRILDPAILNVDSASKALTIDTSNNYYIGTYSLTVNYKNPLNSSDFHIQNFEVNIACDLSETYQFTGSSTNYNYLIGEPLQIDFEPILTYSNTCGYYYEYAANLDVGQPLPSVIEFSWPKVFDISTADRMYHEQQYTIRIQANLLNNGVTVFVNTDFIFTVCMCTAFPCSCSVLTQTSSTSSSSTTTTPAPTTSVEYTSTTTPSPTTSMEFTSTTTEVPSTTPAPTSSYEVHINNYRVTHHDSISYHIHGVQLYNHGISFNYSSTHNISQFNADTYSNHRIIHNYHTFAYNQFNHFNTHFNTHSNFSLDYYTTTINNHCIFNDITTFNYAIIHDNWNNNISNYIYTIPFHNPFFDYCDFLINDYSNDKAGTVLKYSLPQAIDDDGDTIQVQVNYGALQSFSSLSQQSNTNAFTFSPTFKDLGSYIVEITLKDSGTPQLKSSYQLNVEVYKDSEKELKEIIQNSTQDSLVEQFNNDIVLSELQLLYFQSEKYFSMQSKQFQEKAEQFKAQVTKVTMNGQLYLKFNQDYEYKQSTRKFLGLDLKADLISSTLDPSYLKSYYILSYQNKVAILQMVFNDVNFISKSVEDYDQIRVNLTLYDVKPVAKKQKRDLASKSADKVRNKITLQSDIPKQLSSAEAAAIESMATPMKTTLQVAVYSSFALQFVFFPANANYFLTFLIELANMDILPNFEFLKELPLINKLEAASEDTDNEEESLQYAMDTKFQLLGYENIFLLITLKSYIIFMCIGLAGVIFDKILNKAANLKQLTTKENLKNQNFLKRNLLKVYAALISKLYYSFFFRITIENYFTASIMVFQIFYKNFEFTDWKLTSNFFVAFGVFMLLLVFPLYIYWLFKRNVSNMNDLIFHNKFSTLFENTDRQKQYSQNYILLFLGRRVMFGICLGGFNFLIQIYIQIWVSLTLLFFLIRVKPMELQYQNRLDIFNETSLLACLYMCLLYTDIVPDIDTQIKLGWTFCAIIFVNLTTNLSVILYIVTSSFVTRLKYKCNKKLSQNKTVCIMTEQNLKTRAQSFNDSEQCSIPTIKQGQFDNHIRATSQLSFEDYQTRSMFLDESQSNIFSQSPEYQTIQSTLKFKPKQTVAMRVAFQNYLPQQQENTKK